MTKYPPSRTAGLLHMPRLPEGQRTEAMRVRAAADVVHWAASLTPAERGQVFAAAFKSQSASQQASPAQHTQPAARTLTPAKWRK